MASSRPLNRSLPDDPAERDVASSHPRRAAPEGPHCLRGRLGGADRELRPQGAGVRLRVRTPPAAPRSAESLLQGDRGAAGDAGGDRVPDADRARPGVAAAAPAAAQSDRLATAATRSPAGTTAG